MLLLGIVWRLTLVSSIRVPEEQNVGIFCAYVNIFLVVCLSFIIELSLSTAGARLTTALGISEGKIHIPFRCVEYIFKDQRHASICCGFFFFLFQRPHSCSESWNHRIDCRVQIAQVRHRGGQKMFGNKMCCYMYYLSTYPDSCHNVCYPDWWLRTPCCFMWHVWGLWSKIQIAAVINTSQVWRMYLKFITSPYFRLNALKSYWDV